MTQPSQELSFRRSTTHDIPTLTELWYQAFQDQGAYVQHFFQKYRPEQMFLAQREGEILAMTYYFPSTFHHKGKSYATAYLYAVATHPKAEKQGIASALLDHIAQTLPQEDYQALSTVPATPSLHNFFGRNGFSDYFYYDTAPSTASVSQDHTTTATTNLPLSCGDYIQKREAILQGQTLPYITLTQEGFAYQEGVSALGEGGFFQQGEDIFCIEQATDSAVLVKEALSSKNTNLLCTCPMEILETRTVPQGVSLQENWVNFGMLQWLCPPPKDFSFSEFGYLGLAFD